MIVEDVIPDTFNEVDNIEEEGSVLRTLIDFTVFDRDGKMVPVEKICEANACSVQGLVIEPLEQSQRVRIQDLLCTTRQEAPTSVADFAPKIPHQTKRAKLDKLDKLDKTQVQSRESLMASIARRKDSVPTHLDRIALKVGDELDGYCVKTFQWFEAKIVEVDSGDTDRLKIHFKGWNPKYDEWLNRDSDRLAPLGASSLIMFEAAQRAASLVPWFEHAELLSRAALPLADISGNMSRPLWPRRRTQRVLLPVVEDWCIDYTFANPTLWLCSASGAWYRIAGVLCPGGHRGYPSLAYSATFASSQELFLCAAHVAMVVLEYLPAMPKITLKDVADEVTSRTQGAVTERTLLTHSRLLCEQISGLSPPTDWDKKVSIPRSLFMSQLKKYGDVFIKSEGRYGLSSTYEPGNGTEGSSSGGGDEWVTIGSGARKKRKRFSVSVTEEQPKCGSTPPFEKEETPLELPDSIHQLPGWRALFQGVETFDYLTPEELQFSRALLSTYQSRSMALQAAHRQQAYTYPTYPDGEYYSVHLLAGELSAPHPRPGVATVDNQDIRLTAVVDSTSTFCVPRPQPLYCPPTSVGDLLHVWTTLVNFGSILGLRSAVSLSVLDEWLLSPLTTAQIDRDGLRNVSDFMPLDMSTQTQTAAGVVAGAGLHPVLKQAAAAMVGILLQDVESKRRAESVSAGVDAGDWLESDKARNGLFRICTAPAVSITTASSAAGGCVDPYNETTDIEHEEDDKMPLDPLIETHCFAADSLLCRLTRGAQIPLEATTSVSAAIGVAFGKDKTSSNGIHVDYTATASDLRRILYQGDAWLEVFRVYMISTQSVPMPLPEYAEPARAVEIALLQLLAHEDAPPFAKPVDPAAEGLADYSIVVRHPIDLGTILAQLRSGYYDRQTEPVCTATAALSTTQRSAVVDASGCPFVAGDRLDCYHSQVSRWYGAEVVKVELEPSIISDSSSGSPSSAAYNSRDSSLHKTHATIAIVTLRMDGWGANCDGQHDLRLPADSTYLAPHGSRSRHSIRRCTKPDSCDHFVWSPQRKNSGTGTIMATKQMSPKNQCASWAGSAPSTSPDSLALPLHTAVARDVQRVWDNCRLYMSCQSQMQSPSNNVVSPMEQAVCALERRWSELYAKLVLEPIQLARMAQSGGVVDEETFTSTVRRPVSIVNENVIENALPIPSWATEVTSDDGTAAASTCASDNRKVRSVLRLCRIAIEDMEGPDRLKLLSAICTELVQTQRVSALLTGLATSAAKASSGGPAHTLTKNLAVDVPTGEKGGKDDGKTQGIGKVKDRGKSSKSAATTASTIAESSTANVIDDSTADASSTITDHLSGEQRIVSVLRWVPLGRDRDGRVYWVFNQAPTLASQASQSDSARNVISREMRVFCEDTTTTCYTESSSGCSDPTCEWLVYDTVEDVNALLGWLTDRTESEAALQGGLLEWMAASGVPVTVTVDRAAQPVKKGRKLSAAPGATVTTLDRANESGVVDTHTDAVSNDEDAATASTVKTGNAREPISLFEPPAWPWDITDYCDNQLPIALLLTVKFKSGVGTFTLGAGLHCYDRRVWVTGFRDSPGGSAAREAGLRVGDAIAAVDGVAVGTNVEPIKAALAELARKDEYSNSHSSSSSSVQIERRAVAATVGRRRASTKGQSPALTIGAEKTPVALLEEMKQREEQASASGESIVLCMKLLVLRWPDPTKVKGGIAEIAAKDAGAIEKAFAEQRATYKALEAEFEMPTVTTTFHPLHPLREREYSVNGLVGAAADLLLRTAHPFATPEKWSMERNSWIRRLAEAVNAVQLQTQMVFMCLRYVRRTAEIRSLKGNVDRKTVAASRKSLLHCVRLARSNLSVARVQLLATLKECVLALEQAMFTCGNILSADWLASGRRLRYSWRRNISAAASFSQLSLCLSVLISAVEYERLAVASVSMTQKTWIESGMAAQFAGISTSSTPGPKLDTSNELTIPKYKDVKAKSLSSQSSAQPQSNLQLLSKESNLSTIDPCPCPAENSVVLYYGDGHHEAAEQDVAAGLPNMWGESCEPRRGEVYLCVVKATRVLLSGPADTAACHPFAQVDLVVIPTDISGVKVPPIPKLITLNNRSSQRGVAYRITNRIVNILSLSPDAIPFLQPVSLEEHPDYSKYVSTPMDLSLIRRKASNAVYADIVTSRNDCASARLSASFQALKDDVVLLVNNCRKYCEEAYPDIVANAERLHAEFEALAELFVVGAATSQNIEVGLLSDLGTELGQVAETERECDPGTAEVGSVVSGKFAVSNTATSRLNCKINDRDAIIDSASAFIKKALLGSATRGATLPKDGVIGPGISFTVCVRLNCCTGGDKISGYRSCIFLVDFVHYCNKLPSAVPVNAIVIKSTVARSMSTLNSADMSAMGTVVSSKTVKGTINSNVFLPWRWLQVDWADFTSSAGSTDSATNLWEVTVTSSSPRDDTASLDQNRKRGRPWKRSRL